LSAAARKKLIDSKRLDKKYLDKKNVFACDLHFLPHESSKFEKGQDVQYLKEEADAPVDWKKPLTGRSSSKKAGRKRRLSLELAEKISVEAEAARALVLEKRKRKEESDLLWEAKKMRSLPRPRRDASQSVVTA
jgi:hypothetical protein